MNPNPFVGGLHTQGGNFDVRGVPFEIVDAHCEPEALCALTFDHKVAPGHPTNIVAGTPGRGYLVVRAKLSWRKTVTDRIPVTVLPRD